MMLRSIQQKQLVVMQPRRATGFVTLPPFTLQRFGVEQSVCDLDDRRWFLRTVFRMSLTISKRNAGYCTWATRAKRDLNFVYPINVYRGPETDGTPALSRFLNRFT